MTRIKSVTVKVIAWIDDIACLDARFDRDDTPARRYGLVTPIGKFISRGAIYRRHGVFPFEAHLSDAGHAKLVEDLAAHADAQAIGLTAGEFFGLQVSAWRADNDIVWRNCSPMPYWMSLTGLAHYKSERARRARRPDDARRLMDIRSQWQERFEPERVLYHRDIFPATLH